MKGRREVLSRELIEARLKVASSQLTRWQTHENFEFPSHIWSQQWRYDKKNNLKMDFLFSSHSSFNLQASNLNGHPSASVWASWSWSKRMEKAKANGSNVNRRVYFSYEKINCQFNHISLYQTEIKFKIMKITNQFHSIKKWKDNESSSWYLISKKAKFSSQITIVNLY